MQPYSYRQIASDLVLWDRYANTFGDLTDDQFRAMTLEQKIALITQAYGPERMPHENATREATA